MVDNKMTLETWSDQPSLKYKEVYGREGYGDKGAFGIRIFASVDRKVTGEESMAINKAADQIIFAIRAEEMRLDADEQAGKQKTRASLLALFPEYFAVEELPNGYCRDWCCTQKPWYRVLTRIGWVKIGWRKRVISIHWTETIVRPSGTELFPGAEFTVSSKYDEDRYCHAWGYDAARAQLQVIFDAGKAVANG